MVNKCSNGDMILKLSDFGLACIYDEVDPPTKKCGSVLGVAPEILTQHTYGPKVDCWGLGIVLHEILTMVTPFYSEDQQTYMKNIRKDEIDFNNSEIWHTVSDQARDLVDWLL